MISSTTVRKEERKEFAYQYGKNEFRLYAIKKDESLKLIGTVPLSQHKDLNWDKKTRAFIDDLITLVEEDPSLAEELKQKNLKYIAYPMIKLEGEATKIIRYPDCGIMNYEF